MHRRLGAWNIASCCRPRRVRCWRSFSAHDQRVTTDKVRVPSNTGSIHLDVYEPQAQTGRARADAAPHVILYLPRGPFFPDPRQPALSASDSHLYLPDAAIASSLAHASNFTVVQVNYRISPPFPTAIHDVLLGYDWAVKTFSASSAFASRHGRKGTPFIKVGVAGELLGGGLALMLALTECRVGESRIAAAAVNAPVVDWILTPFTEPKRRQGLKKRDGASTLEQFTEDGAAAGGAQKPALTRESLLAARKLVFPESTNPSSYFDRFASPMYFLRTAGVSVPPPTFTSADTETTSLRDQHLSADPDDDPTALDRAEGADFDDAAALKSDAEFAELMGLPHAAGASSTSRDVDGPSPRKRKSPLRYPPAGAALRVPDFRLGLPRTLSLSSSSQKQDPSLPAALRGGTYLAHESDEDAAQLLAVQGAEFARLLRRSLAKYGDASPGCPALVARGIAASFASGGDADDDGLARERALGDALAWAEAKVAVSLPSSADGAGEAVHGRQRGGAGFWGLRGDGSGGLGRWDEDVEKLGLWFREKLR